MNNTQNHPALNVLQRMKDMLNSPLASTLTFQEAKSMEDHALMLTGKAFASNPKKDVPVARTDIMTHGLEVLALVYGQGLVYPGTEYRAVRTLKEEIYRAEMDKKKPSVPLLTAASRLSCALATAREIAQIAFTMEMDNCPNHKRAVNSTMRYAELMQSDDPIISTGIAKQIAASMHNDNNVLRQFEYEHAAMHAVEALKNPACQQMQNACGKIFHHALPKLDKKSQDTILTGLAALLADPDNQAHALVSDVLSPHLTDKETVRDFTELLMGRNGVYDRIGSEEGQAVFCQNMAHVMFDALNKCGAFSFETFTSNDMAIFYHRPNQTTQFGTAEATSGVRQSQFMSEFPVMSETIKYQAAQAAKLTPQ